MWVEAYSTAPTFYELLPIGSLIFVQCRRERELPWPPFMVQMTSLCTNCRHVININVGCEQLPGEWMNESLCPRLEHITLTPHPARCTATRRGTGRGQHLQPPLPSPSSPPQQQHQHQKLQKQHEPMLITGNIITNTPGTVGLGGRVGWIMNLFRSSKRTFWMENIDTETHAVYLKISLIIISEIVSRG